MADAQGRPAAAKPGLATRSHIRPAKCGLAPGTTPTPLTSDLQNLLGGFPIVNLHRERRCCKLALQTMANPNLSLITRQRWPFSRTLLTTVRSTPTVQWRRSCHRQIVSSRMFIDHIYFSNSCLRVWAFCDTCLESLISQKTSPNCSIFASTSSRSTIAPIAPSPAHSVRHYFPIGASISDRNNTMPMVRPG